MTERDPATIWTPAEATGATPGRGRLGGRRILVVGAGAQPCDDADAPIGNGRAISILCAREGASVACADRDEGAARETLRQIETERGRGAVLVADVMDETACAQLVTQAEAALGGLDGIIANVGIGFGRGLEGTDAQSWDHTFAISLRSHFLLARAALPPRHRLGGCLCNRVPARRGIELCHRTAAGRGRGIVELEMRSRAKAPDILTLRPPARPPGSSRPAG